MKVTLNLAVSHTSYQRYAFAWGLPAALVGLLVAIFLGISAATSGREYLVANRDRVHLQGQETDWIEKERALSQKLEQPRVQAVLRSVHFINDAIDRRRVSVTALAEETTQFLPKGVRLTSLALARDEKNLTVRFVLSGQNEEVLEDFLIKLENSPDFKDVAITNQGFDETGAGGAPVRLTCTAHYMP